MFSFWARKSTKKDSDFKIFRKKYHSTDKTTTKGEGLYHDEGVIIHSLK